MSKVHHFYLRRYLKGNGNHPFSTVGVGINPKTGMLHIGTLTLHSTDSHFVKSTARRLIPRKVFGSESWRVRTGDIHFDIGDDLRLENYISDYVKHTTLDMEKAQEMFMGIVRDAVTEYDVDMENDGLKTTIDNFGRIATVEEVELNEKIDKHILCEEAP